MDDRRKDDPLILRGIISADETEPHPEETIRRVFEFFRIRTDEIHVRLGLLEQK
jgi:hypothetical protein